ncbi:MAG: cytochrome P450 [Myxococcota bacterium]
MHVEVASVQFLPRLPDALPQITHGNCSPRYIMAVEFNPFEDLKAQDTSAHYRKLRDEAPVHWSSEGEVFTVSRYEDVQTVLKSPDDFSSEAMRTVLTSALTVTMTPRYAFKLISFLVRTRINPLRFLKVGNLISIDGERHNVLRKIVGKGFTPRRIAAWQPRIEAVVEEHVAKMRKSETIDVVADLAVPLPTIIISEMLGVEPERRADFKHWSSRIIDLASGAAKEDLLNSGVLDDVLEMFVYLRNAVKERRESPGDDLISQLIDPKQEDVLDELDIIQFVVLLLVAGNETTTNLIGNAANALMNNPRQLAEVAADPSLVDRVIDETLRFEPPLTVTFRNTTRDVTLAGVEIPEGSNLAILLSAANRDERQFENPDQFDIHRDATGHLGFGFGVHFCLGSSLARLQAHTALAALIPELDNFRQQGAPSSMIDSFLVRGRESLELHRR